PVRVLVEVDASRKQRRVVDAGNPEHAVIDVGGERGVSATHDAALADAVVHRAGVDTGTGVNYRTRNFGAGTIRVDLERRVGRKTTGRMEHRPLDHHHVDEALLHPVGQLVEVRQVAQRGSDSTEVTFGETVPV